MLYNNLKSLYEVKLMNFLTADAAGQSTGLLGGYGTLIIMVLMLVAMYFILILPQKKKEKKIQEERNNIEVGDEITTIGGVVGRAVSIKDNTIVIETGTDRTKIRFLKEAISHVEKLKLDE